MKKNELIRYKERIYRVLEITEHEILIIDCMKQGMPEWIDAGVVTDTGSISEEELCSNSDLCLPDVEDLAPEDRMIMCRRFTMISNIIPVIGDAKKRSEEIRSASDQYRVSKQTIRKYLCLYLTYQNKVVLSPRRVTLDKPLTNMEKTMRWGLNKFFYTQNKNSLKEAYSMMIKAKYTDETGKLLDEYPSFYQFRYFYRKTRKMQNYLISRDGLKNYQRNNRPLTGDGVQEYATHIGIGMLDSTVCDNLINNSPGNIALHLLSLIESRVISICQICAECVYIR